MCGQLYAINEPPELPAMSTASTQTMQFHARCSISVNPFAPTASWTSKSRAFGSCDHCDWLSQRSNDWKAPHLEYASGAFQSLPVTVLGACRERALSMVSCFNRATYMLPLSIKAHSPSGCIYVYGQGQEANHISVPFFLDKHFSRKLQEPSLELFVAQHTFSRLQAWEEKNLSNT